MTCNSSFTDPVKYRRALTNLHFKISFANLTASDQTIHLSSGYYSACGFRIHLNRKKFQLFSQIYLPCFLFVAVSWVSFLIRPQVVPGRMSLLVTLFLVLINIFNTVRNQSPVPSTSFLNALDTYLVVSIVMVFLALLEYAFVLFAINVCTHCHCIFIISP